MGRLRNKFFAAGIFVGGTWLLLCVSVGVFDTGEEIGVKVFRAVVPFETADCLVIRFDVASHLVATAFQA